MISVVPDLKTFFWIAASVINAAAVNPKGTKTLLANDIGTLFINGNPVLTDGPRKLSNPPRSQLIFLLVPFNKIPPFSKDLITF